MSKAQKQLVKSDENKQIGNHSIRVLRHPVTKDVLIQQFFYHGNQVCEANFLHGLFFLDDCGWGRHSSTTRTLNGYRQYFSTLDGMREVDADDYEAECLKMMEIADRNR